MAETTKRTRAVALRPIIMQTTSVRGIFDGRKTQTRRPLKSQPPPECSIHYMLGAESWIPRDSRTPLRHDWEAWRGPLFAARPAGHMCGFHSVTCPYGQPGDRLWVRETWGEISGKVRYRAEFHEHADTRIRFKSPIHMPFRKSRLTLEIIGIRVERVMDILPRDVQCEGFESRADFAVAWDVINAARGFGWDANPWVWVVDFRRVEHG